MVIKLHLRENLIYGPKKHSLELSFGPSWKAQVWSDKSLLRPHPPALLNSPALFGVAVSSEGHVNISIKIHTFKKWRFITVAGYFALGHNLTYWVYTWERYFLYQISEEKSKSIWVLLNGAT